MIAVDTSFLIRLFVNEPGAESARRWISERQSVIAISNLNHLEFHNALNLKKAWKQLDEEAVALIQREYRADFRAGRFQLMPISQEVWDEATVLAVSHTTALKTRSLDVLQVAFALVHEMEEFGTFDGRQRALAKTCGLTLNPS